MASRPTTSRRLDGSACVGPTWWSTWPQTGLQAHGGSPFFLVLHLFDPHMTYDPPEATKGRFSSAIPDTGRPRLDNGIRAAMRSRIDFDRDYLVALYDDEVAFVDQQLGRLFAALDEAGLSDEIVVVLTSDHGEELFDHRGSEHGHTMYDELLRVPLVVRAPEVQPGRRTEPVSLVDLFPTLLFAFGQPVLQGLPGRSLWPSLHGEGAGPAGPCLPSGLCTARSTRPLSTGRTS